MGKYAKCFCNYLSDSQTDFLSILRPLLYSPSEHMQQELSQHKHLKESNCKLFFYQHLHKKIWGEEYILSCNGVETPCELWPALIVPDFAGTCKALLILMLVLYNNKKISGREVRNGSQSPVNMSATRCHWDYLPVFLESLQMQYVKNEQLLKS